MKSILYITANPKNEENSNSLTVGRCLVNAYLSLHPGAPVTEIDVFRLHIPLVDEHFLSARQKVSSGAEPEELLPAEKNITEQIHRLTAQFIDADVYIFAFPLWNLGVPPLLKAYVDTIKVARKTFRYTPDGPEGLLKNKVAVLIQSSGDVYSSGPLKEFEHGSRYLYSVLSFIGVERIETIYMEGMDRDTNKDAARGKKDRALNKAIEIARTLL
ncbi:FMN-dependent NADH-azoreductase [Paenibacillus nasutitermitis]|uniref:FMN dependent NADH:quinone oxidoreductase n=1 Tax=Paenibacillus nasutitermitis TaxID=1652958 RepID=A0A916YLQ8_9BACL|nr:NAD(P)H-dependent oxidoreductase [Paenibacillus nasutitermitis]GGD50599.1 FMN-dependent NADH-azoreductase 2 [Paenibacillus nasutitermitis]